jgi:hypothetical protein
VPNDQLVPQAPALTLAAVADTRRSRSVRLVSYGLDTASISAGGVLGACIALALCIRGGASDGNLLDVVGAAIVAGVAASIADVQASGFLARLAASVTGASVGTAATVLLTAWFAAAVHSPLLGGWVSGAIGVVLGAALASAVSLTLSRAKPRIFDVALQAGMVNGLAVGVAIGGAAGGLIATEYWRLFTMGADLSKAEAIGIATGSGVGALVGCGLGLGAAVYAAVFTFAEAPSRALETKGARYASIGAASVTLGAAAAAVAAASLTWFASTFVLSAVVRAVLPQLLASAVTDLVALILAAIAVLLVGFGFLSLSTDVYMSEGVWGRLWQGEKGPEDERIWRLALALDALLAGGDLEEEGNGVPWLVGAIGGLLVGAIIVFVLIPGRSSVEMIAITLAIIPVSTFVGVVLGIRLPNKKAPNFQNMKSPLWAAVVRAFERSLTVSFGGLLATTVGLMAGVVVDVALYQMHGRDVLEQDSMAGLAVAVIVGMALGRPLIRLAAAAGGRLSNSSMERALTRRQSPRTIDTPEKEVRLVWEAFLGCRYETAAFSASTIDLKGLTTGHLRDLATATWWSSQGLVEGTLARQTGCQVVLAIRSLLCPERAAEASSSGPTYERAEAAFEEISRATAGLRSDAAREIFDLLGIDNAKVKGGPSETQEAHHDTERHASEDVGKAVSGRAGQGRELVEHGSGPRPVSVPKDVARGGKSHLSVEAAAGAICSLAIRWPSGRLCMARSVKLGRVAGADGAVTWDWRVPKQTKPGTATATVSSRAHGVSGQAIFHFTVS